MRRRRHRRDDAGEEDDGERPVGEDRLRSRAQRIGGKRDCSGVPRKAPVGDEVGKTNLAGIGKVAGLGADESFTVLGREPDRLEERAGDALTILCPWNWFRSWNAFR